MGKRGLTYESFTIHKHLTLAFDITPCGSNFALALDDGPTKYESGKLTKGKQVFAFELSVDRFGRKARNLRLFFIVL